MEPNFDNKETTEQSSLNNKETTEVQKPNIKKHTNISMFSALHEFISSLSENFGKKLHEVELYNLLLENTRVVHTEQISKHLNLFRDYLKTNREAIVKDQLELLTNTDIRYSEKVFINIPSVIEIASPEDKDSIRQHMIVLLALLQPEKEEETMSIIKAEKKNSMNNNPTLSGNSFFDNIFNQVNDTMKDCDENNPMEMINTLLKSDLMSNIMTSMTEQLENVKNQNQNQNQNLDMNNMMNSIQGLMENLGKKQ